MSTNDNPSGSESSSTVADLNGDSLTTKHHIVKVGSRKSQLALIQTGNVIERLSQVHKDVKFEIVTMSTTGDNILDRALSKIGTKNLFTRELEEALLDERVDFVVHSLKDLPTVLPEGLAIGAVCERDDCRDGVILHPKHSGITSLADLPKDSVLGTSSLRRCAQLKRQFPDLALKDVRGNLNTRLRKLEESDNYDALVLAVAGLERMAWHSKIAMRLDPEDFMYAVGQGAMAVECRATDTDMIDFLEPIHHYETTLACVAERALLKTLEGGCSVPVSVCCKLSSEEDVEKLTLKGAVYSIDGTESVIDEDTVTLETTEDGADTAKKVKLSTPPMYSAVVGGEGCRQRGLELAERLGTDLALSLLKNGADKILRAAKDQIEAEIRQQAKPPVPVSGQEAKTSKKECPFKNLPTSMHMHARDDQGNVII